MSCAGGCEGGSGSQANTLGAVCYEDKFAVCGVGRGIRRNGRVGSSMCKVSKVMFHVWLGHFVALQMGIWLSGVRLDVIKLWNMYT